MMQPYMRFRNFFILLDLTIWRGLAVSFVFTLAGLLVVFLIFTVFELWRYIFSNNVGAGVVARYLFYLIPFAVVDLAPICVLVATLAVFTIKARQSEFVAWYAGGQSVYRLALPAMVFAAFVGGGVRLTQEYILPASNTLQDELRARIIGRRARAVAAPDNNRQWLALESPDERLIRIYSYQFDETHKELREPVLFEMEDASGRLRRIVRAERGIFDEQGRLLFNKLTVISMSDGIIRQERRETYTASAEVFAERSLEEVFKPMLNSPSHMNSAQLSSYIQMLKQRGGHPSLELMEVALWRKASDPFAVIIMCLLALPFALATGRRGNLAPLAVSVAIGGAFWFTISGFQQLGVYGLLSPSLAALSPPLIFFACGAYFLSRART